MSNAQRGEVIVVINGTATGLTEAATQARAALDALGGGATEAGAQVKRLGEAEEKTQREARELGESVKIAAESVGLLGIESGESVGKLFLLRDAASDFTRSMGGMKAAILGGVGLTAAFAGFDFLKESVKDSLAGEQATQQLQAALRKTPGAFEETNKAIEEGASSWAKYGLSIGAVKASVAQGVGAGIKAETILGNPKQIADLAVALGERVPDALHEIERGGRGAERVIGRLNLSIVAQRRAMQQLGNTHFSADDRTRFLLDLVQKTAFSGQGDARTKSAQGSIDAFNASMGNLKETVGTDLLPALTDVANTLAGMAQGANAALAGVGGLGNVLQATYKPVLGTLLVGFLGLKLAHSQLGDLLRGRLMGDVAATTGTLAEEEGQAVKTARAIDLIPKTALTTALFDAAAGTAIKEPWIANVLSVPKVAVTTAAFENAGAVAALGAEEARIAAVPRAVSTVATVDTTAATGAIAAEEAQLATLATPRVTPVSVVAGALPVIAVSALATVATVAIADGALAPVTDAVGHLTGRVSAWTAAAYADTVQAAGHITSWIAEPVAQPVSAAGHIASWVYDTPITPASIVGHVASWVADARVPSPEGIAAHIASWIMDAQVKPAETTGRITSWTAATYTTAVQAAGHITTWASDTRPPTIGDLTAHIAHWAWSAPGTIDNLTGAIKHWSLSSMPSLKDLTATIGHWAFGDGNHAPRIEVPGTAEVDRATVRHGVIATIDGRATIGHFTVPANAGVHVTGTADVTRIALPKNTALQIDSAAQVRSITVPKGTSVKIAGDAEITGVRVTRALTVSNVHGTVQIDNATVAPGKHLSIGHVGGTAVIDSATVAAGKHLTIGHVGGTAVIDSATVAAGKHLSIGHVGGTAVIENVIPAPGKHLTISGVSGTAEIAGVTLKKGATVNVAGGTATVNTLNAKAIKYVGPAINSALGFGDKEHPLPLYVKYDVVGGRPTAKPPTPSSGGGPDYGGMAANFGESLAISLISTAVLGRMLSRRGGPPDGGGPGGPNDGGPPGGPGFWSMIKGFAKAPKGTKTVESLLGEFEHWDGATAAKAANQAIKEHAKTAGSASKPIAKDVGGAVDALQAKAVADKIFHGIVNPLVADFQHVGALFGPNVFGKIDWGGIARTASLGLMAGLALFFTRGRSAGPAGAALGVTGGGPTDQFVPERGKDGKTHMRKMTPKELAAQTKADNAMWADAGKWIVTGVIASIKAAAALFTGIGGWIATTIKTGVVKPPAGANTDTRTYGHGSGGKPPTGHPRGEGHWIPVSGNTWVWAPGKPPGHPGNTAGLLPGGAGASGVGGHGVALAHIDTAMLRRLGALTTTPAHHVAAAAAATHQTAQQAHQTVNVGGIHINGAQDPHAVAKEVVEALKSVSSAAHRKRQHGR